MGPGAFIVLASSAWLVRLEWSQTEVVIATANAPDRVRRKFMVPAADAWSFGSTAAIAMVVVGGTTLSGGRGGVGLTLLGVLTIGYLDKILSINAVSEAGRLMLTGAIIVIAVLAQGRRRT